MFSFFISLLRNENAIIHEKILVNATNSFPTIKTKPIFKTLKISNNLNITMIKPENIKHNELHHYFENGDYFIYVYGEIFGVCHTNISEILYNKWISEGETAVQKVDGSFTFMVFNKKDDSVLLICDSLGNRRVHYFMNNDCLIISPHDLIIYGSGLVKKTINKKLVYEMLAYISTRIGESLLKDISYQKPYEIIQIKNDEIVKKLSSPFAHCNPLSKSSNLKDKTWEIINELRSKCSAYTPYADKIEIDLTAGKDTRSVFSLIKDIVPKEKTTIRTLGETNSTDNLLAKKIAKMYHFKHTNIPLEKIDCEEFKENLRIYSYLFNGDTNGLRAVEHLKFQEIDELRFGGVRTTPEAFYSKEMSKKDKYSPTSILDYFIENFYCFKSTPNNEMNEIRNAILDLISDFKQMNNDGEFILKSLVLFTQVSNSGTVINQRNWQLQNIEPFLSNSIASLYYLTPIRKLNKFKLYPEIIRTFAPEIFNLKINGNFFYRFSMIRNNRLIKLGSYLNKFKNKVKNRIKKNTLIYQDSVGESFRNEYINFLHSMLSDSLIIKNEIMTQSLLTEIIQDHLLRKRNHHDYIGILLIVEFFLELIEEIDRKNS